MARATPRCASSPNSSTTPGKSCSRSACSAFSWRKRRAMRGTFHNGTLSFFITSRGWQERNA